MSDAAIKVHGLGKKYRIRHQRRERYVALRDVITDKVRGLFRPRVADGAASTVEDFWALRDVSFEVKRGEVIGIIGRNGAGKSTLLKMMSRITEPSEGRIELEGRVASLLEVGTGFHPELTGRENIFLNGAILGMRHAEIRRRFDEIVAFADVENFLDTPVKRFSSGMYLRLAFAVAAHLETETLIVDEVLAVGDAEFQRRCLGKMKEVGRSGRTVLLVSHQMNSIERLCERVIWLQRGKIAGIFADPRQGIVSYLQANAEHDSGASWRNKSQEFDDHLFRPSWFEIRSDAAEAGPEEPFSNQYPLVVTIAGEIRTVDRLFNLGIAVYSEDGLPLFWSFMRDSPEVDWPVIEPGFVKLRTSIPARWLNEGSYKVELLAGLHYQKWLLAPQANAPSIKFSIRGGLSDSPLWDRKRPGFFAPVLAWHHAAPRHDSQH
jgi:homopolymeric O-antigen transport system ATP-binding protein